MGYSEITLQLPTVQFFIFVFEEKLNYFKVIWFSVFFIESLHSWLQSLLFLEQNPTAPVSQEQALQAEAVSRFMKSLTQDLSLNSGCSHAVC